MLSSHTRTSLTLLDLATQGDAQAWTRLTELYGPLVFHWAQKQGVSDEEAADVTQDVFVSLARNLHRYQRQQGSGFRAWLWVITRNQLVDYFRRQSKNVRAAGGTAAWQKLADHAESLPDDPSQFTDAEPLQDLHHRGLEMVKAEFEERSWKIFERVVMDDASTAVVAEEFGITANSVRQTKSRILRRLRLILGEG